jgi:hypothetical protein
MVKPRAKPANRDREVMLKRPKKRLLLFQFFFTAGVFFTTCGIEEYYYLPQVPEINISTQFNTSAEIKLPSLSGYYYAQSYKIFYRIYISDLNTTSNDTPLNNISSTLLNDYNYIYPNTDPTSISAGTPANTLFTSRNYYELELFQSDINNVLPTGGGNVRLSFPTTLGGFPVLSINNGPEIRLYRSGYFFTVNPNDEKRYFRNTSEINVADYADLVPRTGLSQTFAYVSMYVVASGVNPNMFTPIYSKPTHISVFKLPDNR